MVVREIVEKKVEVVTGYSCDECGKKADGNGRELPYGWATVDIDMAGNLDNVYDHACSVKCFVKQMKYYLKSTPFNPGNKFNGLSTGFIDALLDKIESGNNE